MSQNPNNRNSLLLCFQEIIKMMPQAGDLNAFLAPLESVEDSLELCLKLANKLRLAPESRGDVTIEAQANDMRLKFTIIDNGTPFDPTLTADVDTTLSAEERPIGGLGILLVRQMMDSINYERVDGRNVLTLRKNINHQ